MELRTGVRSLKLSLAGLASNAGKGTFLVTIRWHNHLNPDIKKNKWTEEEDQKIIQLHQDMGN